MSDPPDTHSSSGKSSTPPSESSLETSKTSDSQTTPEATPEAEDIEDGQSCVSPVRTKSSAHFEKFAEIECSPRMAMIGPSPRLFGITIRRLAEIDQVVEIGRLVEVNKAMESKRLAEIKRSADVKRSAEIKRSIEIKDSPETQGSPNISNAEVAYKDLVEAMNTSLCVKPFAIDLLPDSHPLPSGLNVLVEDHTMSVTKATLRKVFPLARREFFERLADISHPSSHEAIMNASAVILLQTPEHLTAANARKRIIMAWEKELWKKGVKQILMDLSLVGSMLMSPLGQHPKSPTLWAHRRWLFRRIPPPNPFPPAGAEDPLPMMSEREITLFGLMAAHNHSANYHAWDYMRWWVENNPELLVTFGQYPITDSKGTTHGLVRGLPAMVNSIQQWCLEHPSDTSGWSFLLWLFTVPATWSLNHLNLQGPFEESCKTIMKRVTSFRVRNEAAWVFLRTIMSAKAMSPVRRREFSLEAHNIQSSIRERARSQEIAAAALNWSGRYGRPATSTV